jgi:diguanylate cyclase (GGDEF)-like protein
MPEQVTQIASLLQDLDEATGVADVTTGPIENRLAHVRLGIASSLFTSLRCKHLATAAHSLRVAIGCSAWAAAMNLSEEERDRIEVAALLHDIGKLGVPDSVLLKPGKLDAEEIAAMERHHMMGLDILQSCCADPEILEIVGYAPAWFDGSTKLFQLSGQELPLGARMVAIVDAFDSMTTDHVWRPARTRERALQELFQCTGTQFDPALVNHFHELHTIDQQQLNGVVTRRWLQSLDPERANRFWQCRQTESPLGEPTPEILFQQRLLDNMYDGVVFVDAQMQIMLWNRGTERLTGIAGPSVLQRPFVPRLIGMRDDKGKLILETDCPIAYALRSGVQSLRRMIILGRKGPVSVDVHAIPVMSRDGTTHGATLLLHDASSEITLEERCQTLHAKATQDPLTHLANRAEFDKGLLDFVQVHQERHLPFSLIICDIDRFKSVNDTYGHQAGDEVIKSFATNLKNFCRAGDLVARYGGEEFVMICADCKSAVAYDRAEQIRKAFGDIRQDCLDGRRVTASFGVTELQAGDDSETMLRRADRALLQAKDAGRNIVIQLGTGLTDAPVEAKAGWWFWRRSLTNVLVEKNLVTLVPLKIAVEKLRGFVADHCATIDLLEGNDVHLKIDASADGPLRRNSDRPVPFLVELHFEERRLQTLGTLGNVTEALQTMIRVSIRPRKERDRRREGILDRANKVLFSLRSYLMANEESPKSDGTPPPNELG